MFITIPSPQVSLQELAVVESPSVQSQPVSTEHVALHPSPESLSPSSQYVAPIGVITFPSPQSSVHELAVVEEPRVQVQPISTEQVLLHPSPSSLSPSSQ